MKKGVYLIIKGHVQKVGFRYHTVHKAIECDINGFVKNRSDGTVYIEAEGEEACLQVFIDWCKIGPDLAQIEEVIIHDNPIVNYKEFVVK